MAEQRREMVMNLPTESGMIVLQALAHKIHAASSHSSALAHKILNAALLEMVTVRWKILWSEMHKRIGNLPGEMLPIEEMPAWYEEKFKELKRLAKHHQQQNEMQFNPNAAWREGVPEKAMPECVQKQPIKNLYPRGAYGTPAPIPKKKVE